MRLRVRRDERGHLVAEPLAAETFGMAADERGIESPGHRPADAVGKRRRRRIVHEDARFVRDDGFERAAAGERNDGATAGLGFDRHDAEVFFAGQQRDAPRRR